jgi:NAD(P)-dependent dehydrogenase (short-subunit alcohol dehydrogenase family)
LHVANLAKLSINLYFEHSPLESYAALLMKIDQTTVAVVTGAASGIGRALASRLASEGASLALADVDHNGLKETARKIGDKPGKVSTHTVDVSDCARVASFVNEVVQQHGRANLLINNAGVGMAGTVEELSIEDIEWLMSINFWGVVYGVKLFLPVLRQQPRAHIVNVSSVFGIIASPGHSAYAASKFALRGFTETLRHELAGSNILVSIVHPGGIKTNIARSARLGAGAHPSALAEENRRFDRASRTTPEAAAERIVRGIMQDETRILVGSDAWVIDRIQRWMPVKYWSFFSPLLDRVMREK